MAEDLSTRIADRLVELAYALDDARLPMPTRVAYVKRELALAAQELLNAHGVNACPEMRSAEQLEDGFPRWDDQGRRIAAGVLAVDAGQAFAEKLARFERLSHRQGELWERCQGKGWPDAESDEFHRLRDELLPALRTDLRALRADGVDVPARAPVPPEPFAPLNEHSKAFLKALADLVGIPSREFKGHPEQDWIRREDAMRLVPALRDHGGALAALLRKELLRAHGVTVDQLREKVRAIPELQAAIERSPAGVAVDLPQQHTSPEKFTSKADVDRAHGVSRLDDKTFSKPDADAS